MKSSGLVVPWILVLIALCGGRAAGEVYVAPDGDDGAGGGVDAPLATLGRAIEIVRDEEGGRKRIIVRGGAYYDVSVTITPEDSGLTIEAAEGEEPVLYGGVRLTGWEKDGDRFYAAALPAGREWDVRMLEVNGRMRPRARYPAEGRLQHTNSFDVRWMSSTGGGWERKPTEEELTTLRWKEGDLGAWLDAGSAEVTVYHMWDESTVGVAGIDLEQRTLKLRPACGHPPGAFGVRDYVVWNIREGLAAPGQWYHDRSGGRIVYWPLPGEEMERVEVIVPTRQSVLVMRGSAQRPVRQVSVRGLGLSVTTVPLVTGGFAAGRFDGCISLRHVEDCVLSGLKVRNVAGHGIDANEGSVRTRIENCEVASCGAGGIYVGGRGSVIFNNHVHGIGLAYPSAIGIYRGGGEGNIVRRNEVHDCSYSAINYGGRGNIIEENLIYDCMKVLHDGAAIYMFAAKECILRGNVARDIVDTGGYGASSYYLDERSEGCVVEGNLSVNVLRPTHNHMALNNTYRHNVFIVDGDAALTFPRSSGFALEGNVIYATGKIRIQNPDAVVKWSGNIVYSGAGRIEGVKLRDYTGAGPAEAVRGDTLVADPLFVDWRRGDYRYKPDSPAGKLGLPEFDASRAGRMGARAGQE